MKPRFKNRVEAGRELAAALVKYAWRPGVIVVGLIRGGVPVAHEVAARLGLPLEILAVRKLGVPCQEELAVGAIAPGGVCVLNDDLIEMLDIGGDVIGAVRLHEEQELERREQLYGGAAGVADAEGKTVIVVDDGVATGATMRAAVLYLRQQNAARIVVTAPVMAIEPLHELERLADEVVAVTVTRQLRGVGRWYEDFPPTTDEEVRKLSGLPETQPVMSSA